MWDYSSVLLSDSFTSYPKNFKTRILAAIWLLVNTLLLSIFSGLLYELIIRGQVIDKIEDQMELFTKDNWKSSVIQIGLDDGFFGDLSYDVSTYSSTGETTGQALLKRSYFNDPIVVYFDKNLQINYFIEMMRNNAVISLRKLSAHLYLRKMQMDWPNVMGLYIPGLDYGMSKTNSGKRCYHLLYYNNVLNASQVNSFNTM